MRGKYRRRRQARIERETGPVATVKKKKSSKRKIIDPHVTLGEIPHARGPIEEHAKKVAELLREVEKFEAAVAEAQKRKRAKKRGCSNIDRNMEALGYRRVSGDEMVPEQFEVIS